MNSARSTGLYLLLCLSIAACGGSTQGGGLTATGSPTGDTKGDLTIEPTPLARNVAMKPRLLAFGGEAQLDYPVDAL